jgi:iron complex outermembrane receptor protein
MLMGSFVVQSINAQIVQDSLKTVDLQSLDVTAERVKLYSSQARILTVIDKQTIRQLPVTNIDELLESVAGIDVRNRGVGGTQADLSIRGGSFDQVLVLLNGVNITDPQTGHYNLDLPVELSDIVRIEFLQGSAARIYGPNAFSGAINIITEKKETGSLAVATSAGSYNTFMENASAGLGNDKVQTFASVTHKSSNGYIDNTDYDIKNAFTQTVLHTNNYGKYDLQLGYQEKSYGANSFYTLAFPNQFDHTQTFYGSLNWNFQMNSQTSFSVQFYTRTHYDRFELFRDFVDASAKYTDHNYHLTNVCGGKTTATIIESFGKVTAGIDVRNEHIYSTVLGTLLEQPVNNIFDKGHDFKYESNRLLPTLFADYTVNMGKFFFSAGLSTTRSDQFGSHTAGGIEGAYHVSDVVRVFASANSAVRLPTFTDLYYKSDNQIANPDLKPEKSQILEFGIKYDKNQLKLSASSFYRYGSDIIDWVKEPDSTKWLSKNLTSVNAVGTDFSADYRFANGFVRKISVAYSFVSLDKKAGGYDSKYALDYLKHKAVMGLQHSILSNLSANWKIGYYDRAGDYTDFATKEKKIYDPYLMADVRFLWSAGSYEIYADINNLFNHNYVDFGGLAQPGRNFVAGVRVKID